MEGETATSFRSQLTVLSHGSTTHSTWKPIRSTPTLWCTLASLGGHLLAVGGQNEQKNCSNSVYEYDANFDVWTKAGSMQQRRSACLVAVPGGSAGKTMVVVGGFVKTNEVTNATEIIMSNL